MRSFSTCFCKDIYVYILQIHTHTSHGQFFAKIMCVYVYIAKLRTHITRAYVSTLYLSQLNSNFLDLSQPGRPCRLNSIFGQEQCFLEQKSARGQTCVWVAANGGWRAAAPGLKPLRSSARPGQQFLWRVAASGLKPLRRRAPACLCGCMCKYMHMQNRIIPVP